MSNVCVWFAIQNLCRARPQNTLPIKRLFSTFDRFHQPAQQSSLIVNVIASARTKGCGSRHVPHSQTRAASNKKKSTRASDRRPVPSTTSAPKQTQPGLEGLASVELKDGRKTASHTEGVLNTESWRDYDPEGGLPLPNGELTQQDIDRIFGKGSTEQGQGNYILCVMHWRRMSGSLIDVGTDFPPFREVSELQAEQALGYLRETYPDVDEQRLGAQWVDEESQKLRQQLENRAVKLGLYKADTSQQEEVEGEEEEEESQQGTAYGRARYGESMLERLRASNIAKREAADRAAELRIANKERALLATVRGPLELAGGLQPQAGLPKRYGTYEVVLQEPSSKASLVQAEPPAWVKYYQQHAQIIKENVIPQMSIFRRLAPSALVFLLVIGGCYYFGSNYTPPALEARILPSLPPSIATLSGLTAVLVGCFIASRLPPLWRMYNKYLAVVPAYPYPASIVGALFRHDTLGHLATNMITLWLIGVTLHEDIGRGWFLATFFATGVCGTMGALTYHVLAKNWTVYVFGASGATNGLLAALCILRPQGSVHIFGYEVPFAAWLILAAAGISNVRNVVIGYRSKHWDGIDHLGHFFGMLGGVTAGLGLRLRFKSDTAVAKQDNSPGVH